MDGERALSCRVLIIPEDPTYDQHILCPLVSRLLRECGKDQARVSVFANPQITSFEKVRRGLPTIVERYRHFDLLLFLPDADGKSVGRKVLFASLEAKLGPKLICCAAVEEVEAWLLAGHIDKLPKPWPEVRADVSVKENVFEPFRKQHGNEGPGGGREELMRATLKNYRGLLERCPELARLQEKICEALA